jgi:type I restriction enzyme S subunit
MDRKFNRIKAAFPDIFTQCTIVNIYYCTEKAKRIAEEADRLSREICPTLIQYIIHDAENY